MTTVMKLTTYQGHEVFVGDDGIFYAFVGGNRVENAKLDALKNDIRKLAAEHFVPFVALIANQFHKPPIQEVRVIGIRRNRATQRHALWVYQTASGASTALVVYDISERQRLERMFVTLDDNYNRRKIEEDADTQLLLSVPTMKPEQYRHPEKQDATETA